MKRTVRIHSVRRDEIDVDRLAAALLLLVREREAVARSLAQPAREPKRRAS